MAFGLYVHWPYCESKCPYCDFNSHVANHIDADRWVSAYQAEIRRVAASCPDEILDTIFIGGGTPSLMRPDVVAAVISSARAAWRSRNDLEITMEANPGSVEAARFAAYREAGVNRVSLGIQSLDDAHLRLLGRKHGVSDAIKAIEIAQSTFERVNIDLIYARQHQTLAEWKSELDQALALGTTHLSLYQLTIEDGTVFGRRHAEGKLPGLPDEDRSVDMFLYTQQRMEQAGRPAYEVSNHAAPGAECRHNLIYWQGGAYAGVGPGAHGRLGQGDLRRATEALRDPADWLRHVEPGLVPELPVAPLNATERVEEALIMGLRLTQGLPLERLRRDGAKTDPWPVKEQLIADGFLRQEADVLYATTTGKLLLNTIVAELASGLDL